MNKIIPIFLIFLFIIAYIFILYILTSYDGHTFSIKINSGAHTSSTNAKDQCDVHSCKSIDPVSDPKYNMQQIVKQSILLEEHLANKNKRCRDCITKHFLHIIGLAEEAQMLATNKIDQYPLINECIELYNRLFKKWLEDPENNVLYCCDELRNMRKRLIATYYF
jgi:hypothetical protein